MSAELCYLSTCNVKPFRCGNLEYKLNYINKTTLDKGNNPIYNERTKRYCKIALYLKNFNYQYSISIRFNLKVLKDDKGTEYERIPDQYKLNIDEYEYPDLKNCVLQVLNTSQLIELLSKVYYFTKNCDICDFIEDFKRYVNRHIDEIIENDVRWIILVEKGIKRPSFITETKGQLLAAVNNLKCKGIDSFYLKCTEINPINKHRRITLNKEITPNKENPDETIRLLPEIFGTNDAPLSLYYVDNSYDESLDDTDLIRLFNYSQIIKYSTIKFSPNVIDGEIQPGRCKLTLTGNGNNSLNSLLLNPKSLKKAFEIKLLTSAQLLMLLNRVDYLVDKDEQIIDRFRPTRTNKFDFNSHDQQIKINFIQRFYEFFKSCIDKKLKIDYIAANKIRWVCIIDRQLILQSDTEILLEDQIIIDRLLRLRIVDESSLLDYYFNSITRPDGTESTTIKRLREEAIIIKKGRKEDEANSIYRRSDEQILEDHRKKLEEEERKRIQQEEKERELEREKEKKLEKEKEISEVVFEKTGMTIDEIKQIPPNDDEKWFSIASKLTDDERSLLRLSFMQRRKLNSVIIPQKMKELTGMTIDEINQIPLTDTEQIKRLESILPRNLPYEYLTLINDDLMHKIETIRAEQEIRELTGMSIDEINQIPLTDTDKLKQLANILEYRHLLYLKIELRKVLKEMKSKIGAVQAMANEFKKLTGGGSYNNLHYKYLSFIQKYNYF